MTTRFPSLLALLCLLAAFTTQADERTPAPAFALPHLQSAETVALEDYRGKVVYVDFWASWCGPCRESLPLLNELRAELGTEQFEVLAVNVDADSADGLRFLERYPVDYPVLADPAGDTPARYQLQGMPTAYLIDAEGQIAHVHEGFKKKDIAAIRSAIQQLQGEAR